MARHARSTVDAVTPTATAATGGNDATRAEAIGQISTAAADINDCRTAAGATVARRAVITPEARRATAAFAAGTGGIGRPRVRRVRAVPQPATTSKGVAR